MKRNTRRNCLMYYQNSKKSVTGQVKKSDIFLKQTKWLGHEIDENGMKPNEEKVEAIQKLKSLNSTKVLKSFLSAIQYLAKFLPKLSEKTDLLRKVLRKNGYGTGGEEEKIFNQIKQMLTEKPCLAHYEKTMIIW